MMHISFKEVPDNYTLCIKTDCPMADHCLRQIAMQVLTKRNKVVYYPYWQYGLLSLASVLREFIDS